MRLQDRLAKLELLHPLPADIDAVALERAELLLAMDDSIGGPHPRAPGAVEKLAGEIAANMRAHGAGHGHR